MLASLTLIVLFEIAGDLCPQVTCKPRITADSFIASHPYG
jgi:hypothetical protein